MYFLLFVLIRITRVFIHFQPALSQFRALSTKNIFIGDPTPNNPTGTTLRFQRTAFFTEHHRTTASVSQVFSYGTKFLTLIWTFFHRPAMSPIFTLVLACCIACQHLNVVFHFIGCKSKFKINACCHHISFVEVVSCQIYI